MCRSRWHCWHFIKWPSIRFDWELYRASNPWQGVEKWLAQIKKEIAKALNKGDLATEPMAPTQKPASHLVVVDRRP